jgi:hypothetical protein
MRFDLGSSGRLREGFGRERAAVPLALTLYDNKDTSDL